MTISASNTPELLVEQQDRILILTLNRPERLNAISRDMLSELSAKLVEANKDPDIRCIVLTGAGRGFCSGLDLQAVGEGGIGSRNEPRGSNRPRQLFDLRDAPINVMWNIDTAGGMRGERRRRWLRHGHDPARRHPHRRRLRQDGGGDGEAQRRPRERRHLAAAAPDRLGQGGRTLLPRPHHRCPGGARHWPRQHRRHERGTHAHRHAVGRRDRRQRAHGGADHQAHDAHGARRVLRHGGGPPDGAPSTACSRARISRRA